MSPSMIALEVTRRPLRDEGARVHGGATVEF